MTEIATGAILRDGKILLVKRSPERAVLPGIWDLPGGHVEADETPEAAMLRELREEIAIEVTHLEWLISTPIVTEGREILLHVYAIRLWRGEPSNAAPNEHDELAWFAIRDAEAVTLPCYTLLWAKLIAAGNA